MLLADSLSRSPSTDSTEMDLDLQIHHVTMYNLHRNDLIR